MADISSSIDDQPKVEKEEEEKPKEEEEEEEEEEKPKEQVMKEGWGDIVDDNDEETTTTTTTTTTSTSEEKSLTPDMDALKIQEENNTTTTTHKFLDEPEDSNIKAVTSGDTLYSTAKKFEDLNLSDELIKGLYVEMKFDRPSKIQSITLPMILTPPYEDLIAQAHNGSGKTTCFVLGMLSRVDPNLKATQAICICPTRELAIQNLEVLRKMGTYTGITSYCAVPMNKSDTPITKRLAITDHVVIGTPGTLKKWMAPKKLSTRDVKILVFDEADHMLAEDGFQDDSLRIIKDIKKSWRLSKPNETSETSKPFQVLLFSATFNETVKTFVPRVVKNENQLFVKKEDLSLDAVKQYKVNCPDESAKINIIRSKIFELGEKVGQTIIFVKTRESAKALHSSLVADGYGCTTIHGAVEKDSRDQIVKEFKDGYTKVLISTDLLARGFDQSQVNLVVNYDLPAKHGCPKEPDYEVYLHRCGRAGRFGRKGAVFNLLCTRMDHIVMEKIEKHFGNYVGEVANWESEEDFEAALKAAGLI